MVYIIYSKLPLQIPGKVDVACVIHSHFDLAHVGLFNLIYRKKKYWEKCHTFRVQNSCMVSLSLQQMCLKPVKYGRIM